MRFFILTIPNFEACWRGDKHHFMVHRELVDPSLKVGAVLVLQEANTQSLVLQEANKQRTLRVRLSHVEAVVGESLSALSFHHFHRKNGMSCCKAMEDMT